MKNGQTVAAFERAFAEYVGAKYAIALVNGTATLHTALAALGAGPGDRVAVPPLTMSATTIAVLHAGATPVFVDVDPATWLMGDPYQGGHGPYWHLPVSLYGLTDRRWTARKEDGCAVVLDAAQTLVRDHHESGGTGDKYPTRPDFVSYSFQASKILALGEGGMLVTDDEALATRAREFSSLGYRMRADQPRIDPAALKSPTFDRHYSLGWNYRMNDLTAAEGLSLVEKQMGTRMADVLLAQRRAAADEYRDAIAGCDWLTPQHVPDGWTHSWWTFAVACDTPERARWLADAVVRHGGERPYPAWKLTYHEPAFRYLDPTGPCPTCGRARVGHRVEVCPDCATVPSACPIAESLQPRLVHFQTNNGPDAGRNAEALWHAIREAA